MTVLDAESGYGNCFHALFSRRLSRLYVSGIGERWDRLDAAWAIAIVQIVRGDPRRKAYFYATQKFRRKSKVVFNVEGPIRLKTVEPVFISSTATILLAFISLIVEIRSGYPAHSRKLKCEIVSVIRVKSEMLKLLHESCKCFNISSTHSVTNCCCHGEMRTITIN